MSPVADLAHYPLPFPPFSPSTLSCRKQITFNYSNPSEHYHIPLLLSPHSYTTYRGS